MTPDSSPRMVFARAFRRLSARASEGFLVGLTLVATILFVDAPGATGQYAPKQAVAVDAGMRAVTCRAQESKNTVLYMNGMTTTFGAAALSVIELREKFNAESGMGAEETLFLLAYNRTQGFLKDFSETSRQRCKENLGECPRISSFNLIHALLFATGEKLACEFLSESATIPPGSEKPVSSDWGIVAEDLRKHEMAIRNKLLEGNRVLLVAHSQGNLFANRALKTFGALEGQQPGTSDSGSDVYKDSLGVVSVATPSSSTTGPYITQDRDLVIKVVRAAYRGIKAPNCHNVDASGEDCLHHGFVEAYLNGDDCGGKVISEMKSVLSGLSLPKKKATTGIITITLSWGSQPDVDLHVIEPNGKHVFYQEKKGHSGYLDVDDTNGEGPEHYFVACDKLEVGTYSFGLNYFAGNRPEDARVQVQAGLEVKHVSKRLMQSHGQSGDNNWLPMGKITVTGNAANREFVFSVD
jgi:hypothetical protein